MRRISVLVLVLAAAAVSGQERAACCPTSEKVYFPGGFDHSDGLRAYIDIKSQKMAVADQVFPLHDCKEAISRLCFISEYFTFSSRHYKDVATWSANGYQFTIVSTGSCKPEVCKNAPLGTYIIFSRQGDKNIEFYYNDQCGLMGWKVAYDVLEDGFMDIETYNVPAYIPDN